MNMFKIVQALDRVGFDGCINPDHIPIIEGDYADGMTGDQVSHQGLAYAVGYIKSSAGSPGGGALSALPANPGQIASLSW